MSTLSSIEQQSCLDWSQLPVDVLKILAKKINSIEDLCSFGGVCTSWRCVTLLIRNDQNKTLPWLMLTADFNHGYRDFYSVAENKTYRLNLPQTFLGYQSYGSPFGWLFNLDRRTEECHLFNPFSSSSSSSSPTRRLPLPPLRTCPGWFGDVADFHLKQYIFKAAVFQFPHQDLKQYDNHNQFLVFIIHGVHKNLAYCRSGDAFWTGVAFPDTSSSSQDQLDILQLNDQFYSVDSHGSIWLLCDVASGAPNPTTAIPFASPPPMSERLKNRCESMFSLIEMGGELHVAVRFQRRKTRKTCLIEIFKCDLCTREWQKLKTLGDYALFLGTGTSISVKASEFSACNCETGYIYFCYADYNYPSIRAPPDIGIIDVDRHEIEYLNVGDKRTRRFSLPAWVSDYSGGPYYHLTTGRRDSLASFADIVASEVTSPQDDLSKTLTSYASKGFDERETVSLLGAYSIGVAHCHFFRSHL
ncbi:hypothetical protein AQUCO_02000223v1 [Aquilegia coerulea]|uniref:Plant heme peroxidase family profile domain-containing protein n=1 Tax=Aquilegia coerulea TaxID=218851 RepID=A0A2G5DGH4_AQUCA|nr:hypothetical protein AQUCO_02000223v1 [Aquilegia coerulea]